MAKKTIIHIGTKRHSGRYPWGSGGDLLSTIDKLQSKGLSEKEVATALDMSTTALRNQKALATAEQREGRRIRVIRERDNGVSVAAISRDLNIPESTIRDLLAPHVTKKFQIIRDLADLLKAMVGKGDFVDVGKGVEAHLGVSRTKLDNAVKIVGERGA